MSADQTRKIEQMYKALRKAEVVHNRQIDLMTEILKKLGKGEYYSAELKLRSYINNHVSKSESPDGK